LYLSNAECPLMSLGVTIGVLGKALCIVSIDSMQALGWFFFSLIRL
jgi:hypothetical protein